MKRSTLDRLEHNGFVRSELLPADGWSATRVYRLGGRNMKRIAVVLMLVVLASVAVCSAADVTRVSAPHKMAEPVRCKHSGEWLFPGLDLGMWWELLLVAWIGV